VAEGPGRQCMGYVLGKAEGVGEGWHGHVTAVTVAPEFRCAQPHVCDVVMNACVCCRSQMRADLEVLQYPQLGFAHMN
jgi:hypothetical protein